MQSAACKHPLSGSSSPPRSSHRSTARMANTGRVSYSTLRPDYQKLVDQLVSDIIADAVMVHSTREKYVSGSASRHRAGRKTGRRTRTASVRKERGRRSQSELRGGRTPTLFLASDLKPLSRPVRCLYVSLHDLPAASSFSYKDDTVCDSLEDLIAVKVRQLEQNADPDSPMTSPEVSKSLDFLLTSTSPIRSEKGREKIQLDGDYDDHYDEYLNSIPLFKAQISESRTEMTRTFSFTQRIISCNLKHHQPDDFDVESLTISVKNSVRGRKVRDERDASVRNLPVFVTSLNLSRNGLL